MVIKMIRLAFLAFTIAVGRVCCMASGRLRRPRPVHQAAGLAYLLPASFMFGWRLRASTPPAQW